ncbi:MAG: c-type cytochrome [Aequorivita sp.]
MKKFKFLTKRLAVLFSVGIGLIVLVFIVLQYFISNPDALKSKEALAKDWEPRDVEEDLTTTFITPEVRYGYEVLTETQKYLGPQAEKPEMRLSGNNLKCTSCHLEAGNLAGSGSWAGVTQRYPSFRGRSNAMGTIEDRINGCMERSMNGEILEHKSKEMRGMVAYMEWLSEGIPKDRVKEISGFTHVEIPDIAVDLKKGKDVFTKHCVQCHQEDGQGVKFDDFKEGYQYPPLWGDDTFNDGAGMHRVITAAQFIKANMPYLLATRDSPVLTDEEAYNVAGYINSFKRPEKANKENDFPDKKLKPVSTPYGPWADDFSQEQHQFGPFPPIIAYYKEKYDIKKTK